MAIRSRRQLRPTVALAVGIAWTLGVVGCRQVLSSVSVLCNLPAVPDHWVEAWGEPGFRVQWRSHPTIHGECVLTPGTDQCVLQLPRGAVVSALAWPIWAEGGPALQPSESLRPAGAIWDGRLPVQDDVRRSGLLAPSGIDLTWQEGPLADLVHEAARLGAETQALNHIRLATEISERLSVDPWLLDRNRLMRAICEHSMRVSYIREIPRESVTARIPDGPWIAASPFIPPIQSGVHDLELPTGISAFYDGRSRRLVISVDEDGRSWVAISPPD